MERRLPPPPYKLVTFKHSTPSWASTYSQHVFDCINDPMGQGFEGSLQFIPDYCIELRDRIVKMIDEVNLDPSLHGTGCKYYLIKVNAIDGNARSSEPGHGKARGWILLKLANMYEMFRVSGGTGYEKDESLVGKVDVLPGYSEGEGSKNSFPISLQGSSKN
ncbi:hypothetical protein TWF730_006568 [Orbilia blumenaviensis]|uniref:Uncharacterized protein n=1 Tax=Orbilia blumenaviensis TaxID=1796055 RepID=A0AAV9VEN9_9PEZI